MPPWVPPQEVRLARLGQFLDGDGIPMARWLQACMAATTANITIASDIDVGDTLDGVLLATGDRVLVKDQTVGTENGIYVVDSDGSANRSPDMPTGMDVLGCMVLVNAGTVNEGSLFRVSGLEPQVVDGGDLTFVEFQAGTAADLVYDDSESADVDDVDAALDLILLALFFRAVLGDEVDRWYDEPAATTDQGAALSNVTRQTSPAGPGGRAYLNATGDHQTYVTFTGLTVGARIRVEAQTNGDGAVGGSGGGTFLRLVTNAGNTDLDSSQVTWVRRSAVVVIGASTNLEIKGVFSPSWGDLIVTNLDDMGENAAGGGGVTDADYLVGTAHAGLSAEIVVGATPGGELGGTWAAPTVDATHSGSTHAAAQAAAEATAAAALSAHDTDTTAVHGIANTASLYAAGGTDVAVADGGTGASTALAARTNLGIPNYWTEITKSADQTVTNSAVLVNDSELAFNCTSGKVYIVEILLLYSGNDATGDYRFNYTLPTVTGHHRWIAGFGAGDGVSVNTGVTMSALATFGADFITGTDAVDGIRPVFIEMMFRAGATTAFTFKFANSAPSSGRTSTTRAGSILRYRQLN